jgi:hypothetical protein
MASFQLVGLPYTSFAPLFLLSDVQLARIEARRAVADSKQGFPCRVSLADAEVGDELLLLPFEHQPAASPYRSSGPIFVRKDAAQCVTEPGVIPDYVRTRLISVRAYDSEHQMIDAAVCQGGEATRAIDEIFRRAEAAYIHLHNAKRGCFLCTVRRID